MAKYTNTIPTSKPQVVLLDAIASYLKTNGFQLADAEQNIWKKSSVFANPLFVRCQVQPQSLTVEAWLRFVLLPGVYLGEYDLEGMFLIVQKRQLKKYVEAIEQLAR